MLPLILAALLAWPALALYLPGIHPNEYVDGEIVELKVNKLDSAKTQLPYDFYAIPGCKPKEIIRSSENLGEILSGDLIQNSPYILNMRQNKSCEFLCKIRLDNSALKIFEEMVDEEYLVNWMVDALPAATRYDIGPTKRSSISGFPVGVSQNGRYYISNHVTLRLSYHSEPNEYKGYRIVGFEVQPRSVTQLTRGDPNSETGFAAVCEGNSVLPIFDLHSHEELVFTYDVVWHESPVRWASRWDVYLKGSGSKVHWFSLLNSVITVFFLSGAVGWILLRTLRRDIAKYNEMETAEDAADETGWKLVHGDVFRRPRFSKLFVVCVGTGVQVLGMCSVTLIFSFFGLMSPAHRGALLQSAMLVYTFMGILAGYVASRLYKTFNGEDWKLMTIQTALIFPGLFFTIFFILNLFIWGQRSSGAVPFGTMFEMLLLWFGISVPLVFVGSVAGLRAEPIELPVRTNQVKREIPPIPWYMDVVVVSAVAGLLPFATVYTELTFVFSSIWHHQFYHLFGFLGIVLVLLVITCAEVSIAVTYFLLTTEDYHWWWRSFFSCGFSGVYVFLYGVAYFFTKLAMDKFVGILLYFGYILLMSILFFLLSGSIGMISAFFFCKSIYGSIKVD